MTVPTAVNLSIVGDFRSIFLEQVSLRCPVRINLEKKKRRKKTPRRGKKAVIAKHVF